MSRGTVCRSWEMWFVSLFILVAAFAVLAFAPGKAEAATGTTSYRYTSEPGDYIGAGERNVYTAADSSISVQGTSADLTAVIERGGETWDVELAAPRGETLHPGRYYESERAPSARADHPAWTSRDTVAGATRSGVGSP